MKRLILCLLLAAASVSAREKLQGWCQEGNQSVVTNGVSSSTKAQRSYPSCTVTVYLTGTLTLASIYSDNSSTPKSNPFTASVGGIWFFYADNGRYDVKFSGGGISTPFTLGDFSLLDLTGGYLTSINSQTGPAITLATATTGTNFTISASSNTITFAIPNASATARGLLTAADFNTFNAKESPLTFNAPLSRSVNTISLPTLGISYGGTGQITANAAFNALAPTLSAGDLIVYNGSINTRLAAGTTGQCLKANTVLANKMEWATCSGGTLTVPEGGTGATTLTGSLVGNGTSPFTAVVASSPLQFYRRQPNVSTTTYQFTGAKLVNSEDFDFPQQAPGGSLTASVGASITLSPCPLGLNGADTDHYIYISGGVGSAEAVLITGGSCTSGGASGTVTFTPANNHSGAWVVTSATQGIQEGICYLPAADNAVRIPSASITLNADVGYCGKTDARLEIANGATFSGAGALPSTIGSGFVTNDYRVNSIGTTGSRLASVALTAQTAAITTTNLIASAPGGMYRISGYAQNTTASTGACSSDIDLAWTYDSVAQSTTAETLDHMGGGGFAIIPVTTVRVDDSTNITYAVTLSGGGNCMNAEYAIFIVAERVQ